MTRPIGTMSLVAQRVASVRLLWSCSGGRLCQSAYVREGQGRDGGTDPRIGSGTRGGQGLDREIAALQASTAVKMPPCPNCGPLFDGKKNSCRS